jgi:hypothetical protein
MMGPAIVLHVLVDFGAGIIAWLALRGGQATGGGVEVEKQTETQPASGVELDPVRAEPDAAPDPARE